MSIAEYRPFYRRGARSWVVNRHHYVILVVVPAYGGSSSRVRAMSINEPVDMGHGSIHVLGAGSRDDHAPWWVGSWPCR